MKPGQTIAHYEILSTLGRGGMGEVYLAQDTTLGRQVALKFLSAPFTEDADRLRRFEQEARAASALNHPHILTIYEIADAEGHRYIASEFIDGETLRQRLSSHRVAIGDVLRIAEQVASALDQAHAAGIIHRDIKPENIMLRRDGFVKVLDFGLAKLADQKESGPEDRTQPMVNTRAGVIMGTVAYMSPEQARGLPVDARTDIWSLGVVLYEMLGGAPPFGGPTSSDILAAVLERTPPPLAESRIPIELRRIVTKALRKDREERYQTVKDLLIDLRSLKQDLEFQAQLESSLPASSRPGPQAAVGAAHRQARGRTQRIGALIALAILSGAALAAYFYFNHRSPLSDKDTILLADFVNTTGDATFDGSTLKQALAVQLRQTPFLNLFAEESVRETLRYMGRQENENITPQVGREICQRRGLKALLVGTIAGLGRNYVVTLEAINGQTGEAIAGQQVEAEGKEQVLKSLGQAALELRRQLGESLSTLQQYNAPIEQATTSSLDALNVYSKGLEQIYSGHSREALPLFNRAVEIDPNFAEAYVWLSWTYANLGDWGQTAHFAEKAYALRDRGTELEKLHIDDIYHLWATGDWEKQKEADELIKRLYPHDWVPHNSLIIGFTAIGQREAAVAEARDGIHLNPNEVHLYWHLATALVGLNRYEAAREAILEGRAHKLDHSGYRVYLYQVAFVQGNAAEMQQQLDAIRQQDSERGGLLWQARAKAFAGEWREARAFYLRANESGSRAAPASAVPLSIEATIRAANFGFCESSGRDTAQVMALSRITSPAQIPYVPVLPDGSLCGDVTGAQKLADEQARRYPRATRINAFSVPITRAAIALRHNQPDRAIESLKMAAPYEGGAAGFWPPYLRGQAYMRLGKATEATAEFQKILDHRGWDPLSPFYPLAHLGLARAKAAAADMAGSRQAYQAFFVVWKDADADLPILMEAKREYERLR